MLTAAAAKELARKNIAVNACTHNILDKVERLAKAGCTTTAIEIDRITVAGDVWPLCRELLEGLGYKVVDLGSNAYGISWS
jgi:hypothetical protein